MNLNELEISHTLRQSDWHGDVRPILDQYGWHVLGSGAEAIVARHPHKPYALKLYYSGSAYSYFVNLVQDHENNPHLPRFSRYVRRVPGAKNWMYVRMEILTRVTPEQLTSTYLPYMCEIDRQISQPNIERKGIYWNSAMRDSYVSSKYSYKNLDACADNSPTSWQQAVRLVLSQAVKHNVKQIDLHYNNMMLRGNTLVITDPLV